MAAAASGSSSRNEKFFFSNRDAKILECFTVDGLLQALSTLGALLQERDLAYEVVAIAGGSLQLQGLSSRPTKDIDVLAVVSNGAYEYARPLPAPLQEAIADTANVLALAPDWFNSGPTDQLKQGSPDGFERRTVTTRFGGLTLRLASREDLVCLKVYAAADGGRTSKHITDLVTLKPADSELEWSARWVKTWDMGPEFSQFVDDVVAHVKAARDAK